MTTIEVNLQHVRSRIEAACERAGRDVNAVTLLAVSKTFDVDDVLKAYEAGQTAFGENYVQEGVEKVLALEELDRVAGVPSGVQWHCIGPVQSNKTRLVAAHFQWVQSVDRVKIAQRLNDQRPEHLPPLQVCLQVNTDGGLNKSGVDADELYELAAAVHDMPRLTLRGLMSIPEPAPDFETQRGLFLRAKVLFDSLNDRGYGLDTLSMGMSDDLEAAISAGSTMVRIGRAVFGHRPRKG